MTNSEVNGIEEAPAPSARSQQIFKNFRDATVALMDCDDTLEGVQDAVLKMLDHFNCELGGADELIIQNIRRVMSNVFGLDDAGEEEPHPLAPATGPYKEIRAEGFTLVDGAGAEHARLLVAGGGAVLTMLDSQGRTRLRLRAGDDEATIAIYGERGEAGKGVLSATDEVERVTIGYESRAQDPRIVIKDGNENECASMEIDNVEPYDGFVRLRRPADGGHTIIDSDGLIAIDGKREPRPEYRDHQAAAPATGPASDRKPGARPELSDDAIRDLVRRIIPCDDDDAVKSFILLVDTIASNDEWVNRNNMATRIFDAAYQRTEAYHEVAGKFFDEATAELRPQAS
jgi:hypothetical protein